MASIQLSGGTASVDNRSSPSPSEMWTSCTLCGCAINVAAIDSHLSGRCHAQQLAMMMQYNQGLVFAAQVRAYHVAQAYQAQVLTTLAYQAQIAEAMRTMSIDQQSLEPTSSSPSSPPFSSPWAIRDVQKDVSSIAIPFEQKHKVVEHNQEINPASKQSGLPEIKHGEKIARTEQSIVRESKSNLDGDVRHTAAISASAGSKTLKATKHGIAQADNPRRSDVEENKTGEKQSTWKCTVCDITMDPTSQAEHERGKRHRSAVTGTVTRKQCKKGKKISIEGGRGWNSKRVSGPQYTDWVTGGFAYFGDYLPCDVAKM